MCKKATYLLVIDYASSYVEIAKLAATTSPDVILHLRSIFAHITSSPRYPQSNGKAERTVQTVKAMLKKSVDPYGALLAYRTTTLECGYSPAQLPMGRQLRMSIPVTTSTLQLRWDESKQLRKYQDSADG